MSSNARKIALQIVSDVVDDGAFLNLSIKKHLPQIKEVENRRFATALAAGTIQNLFRIDVIIKEHVHTKRVHRVIQNILRIGVCQLMFFESVPQSAAVNESVKLAELCGKGQLKGFVNGVLRSVSSHLCEVTYPDAAARPVEYLSLFYSYPKWLCEKYINEYGFAFAQEMLSYTADTTLTCIRVEKEALSKEEAEWADSLLPGKYIDDARYIKSAAAIDDMPQYKTGGITPQSEASMLCVRAAGIQPRDALLDVCAAPGGKTAYAAGMCREIIAADLHEHRVQLIERNLNRLSIKNAKTLVMDGTVFHSEWESKYDVVLLDAPCSELGLLYRKPDIKIRKTQEDITGIIETQRALLSNCSRYIRKGGKMLYSTCTINIDENQKNIEWFLDNYPDYVLDDMTGDIPETLQNRINNGTLQLFPHLDGTDGFFIARLRRR